MTVEMVIKRLYFASAKKRGNCTFRFEKLYVSFSRLYIPFRYEGGIDGFVQNEILPYTPDAWIDCESIQEGYELSFTKYFYKPKSLRSIDDISQDIRAIENRINGMLDDILGVI